MRKAIASVTMFAVIVLIASAALYADDTSKTDSTPTPTPHARAGRLTKPWNELKDLSADQAQKIKEIHAKYQAQIKELTAREKEECMDVLSDDQKKELSDAEAKNAADRKAKAAGRATTAPSETK